MLRSAPGALSPAAPSRAPWPKPARPTNLPRRQNAEATGAALPLAPAPLPQPLAPRSGVHMASSDRYNSPAAVAHDPRAQSRSQAPRHILQIAIHSSQIVDDPSPSLRADVNLTTSLIP